MQVKDAMTLNPIGVLPQATIAEAIRLMLDRHISGLPVIDKTGELVGMLSEGDLLRRAETGTQKGRLRFLEWLIDPGKLALEYTKTHGRLVSEVMTNDAWTVGEDASLAEAVALMERHGVKRLPVLRAGQVVGIVTRADLLRALVGFVSPTYEDTMATDVQIRSAIHTELQAQSWAPAAAIEVTVKDGVVTLGGTIFDDRQRQALRVIAENVTGSKSVVDNLVWIEPYSGALLSTV